MKIRNVLGMLLLSAISGLTVLGAPPQAEQSIRKPQPGEGGARSAVPRATWQSNDHLLATCVAISNQEEVALAEFAEKKLSDGEVKKFARTLIDDHTAFLKSLEQYAPEATKDGYLANHRTATREKPETGNTESKVIPRTAAKPNLDEKQQASPPIDVLQLHREIAQQCLSNAEKMLNEKKGAEFDKCFIGMQIGMHAGMISTLETFERHASGPLKGVFSEGLATTKSHLEQAEELMDRLENATKTAESTRTK